jgi:hypothetical protein
MKKVTKMKKWMMSLLTVAAMFGLVANAAAGVIETGTHYNLEMSSPVSVGDGSEDLLAVIFTARKANSLEAGPDTFDGTAGGRYGIGQGTDLHHEQVGDMTGAITDITPDESEGESPIDSRFLVLDGLVTVNAPDEPEISPTSSNEASTGTFTFLTFDLGETGFGSPLTGAFGLSGGNSADTWDFAYIVVKSGTVLDYNFGIFGGGFGDTFDGSVTIPEPMTMSLLAIGGLGALIRRRKAASFRKARNVR